MVCEFPGRKKLEIRFEDPEFRPDRNYWRDTGCVTILNDISFLSFDRPRLPVRQPDAAIIFVCGEKVAC
jgi:hypothetical protein